MLLHGNASKLREGRLEVWQLQGVRPVVLVGRTQDLEDFEDLIDLAVSHEERLLLSHLSEDAPSGPEIDSERVVLLAQENLRAPVPQRYHLVRVRLDWQPKGPCQTEVGQFYCFAVLTDE